MISDFFSSHLYMYVRVQNGTWMKLRSGLELLVQIIPWLEMIPVKLKAEESKRRRRKEGKVKDRLSFDVDEPIIHFFDLN